MNFSLTLEINQMCNLSCKYCYLGKKNNQIMDIDIAERAIKMAFYRAQKLNMKEVQFDFIGGEPLITFDIMNEIMDFILFENIEHEFDLKFSITTNGTIMNKRILDFLIKYNFDIKLSLDGDKKVNDQNRIFKNSKESVYENVVRNMRFFKIYEEKTKKYVQVTNVITKNNFKNYYKSVMHLVNDLKFKNIDVAIDYTTNWEYDEIDEIKKGIENVLTECLREKTFYFTDIGNISMKSKKVERCYVCGAGIISLYVRTNGDIFCCPTNLNSDVCLGNVYTGINESKVLYLSKFYKIDNSICDSCYINEYCMAKGCLMGNLLENNDINIPCKFSCSLERFYFSLCKKYKIY